MEYQLNITLAAGIPVWNLTINSVPAFATPDNPNGTQTRLMPQKSFAMRLSIRKAFEDARYDKDAINEVVLYVFKRLVDAGFKYN